MSTVAEIWKPVVGYDGIYEVSSHGSIRSLDRIDHRGWQRKGQPMALAANRKNGGRLMVTLYKEGRRRTEYVHRIVATAFLGPNPDGMEVCHYDGNCANNQVGNLRWDTRSANMFDSVRHGINPSTRKTHCPRGHELVEPNLCNYARKRRARACLACNKAQRFIAHRPELSDELQGVSDYFHGLIMSGQFRQGGAA